MLVHILGLSASIMSLLIWLPQTKHTWQHRNDPEEMSAISTMTQVLLIANNILWILYGTRIPNGFWVWASAIVNIPVGVLTMFLIYRAKRQLAATSPAQPANRATAATAATGA